MHIKPTKIKTCMYTVGLKNMTTYERVKSETAEPITDTYFELKMMCLFYFVLESEKKTGIISRLHWFMRNKSIFPFYILSFFISIPN